MFVEETITKLSGHGFNGICKYHGKTTGFRWKVYTKTRRPKVVNEFLTCASKEWPNKGRRCGAELK